MNNMHKQYIIGITAVSVSIVAGALYYLYTKVPKEVEPKIEQKEDEHKENKN